MADLCLGTVQFGMKYGINNKYGQPSLKDSFEMFDIALDRGINIIDTARAYGDAEVILGKYINLSKKKHDMKIISKLKPNILDTEKGTPQEIVSNQLKGSLQIMNIDKLDGYLLHTPEYVYNDDILDGLKRSKDAGLVDHIGVSIYDIKEGIAAIDSGIIDYIQLPYSVFDQRGMVTQFFKKAKKANITIFCRSAFLQGLILMNKEEIPDYLVDAKRYITILDNLLNKYEISKIDALIHFVTDNEYIDYLVFGVDKKEQLIYNIESYRNKSIPYEFIKEVQEQICNIGKSIILPSLWKK